MDQHSTVDPAEVEKFRQIAADWWNPEGTSKPLHLLNPARLDYIVTQLLAEFGSNPAEPLSLSGLQILDIGCGGGLVAEPLARLGAVVTGIDAASDTIPVARQHAADQGLDITYRTATAEELVAEGQRFDAVLALEIIEHVADPAAFIAVCGQLIDPGAPLIVSTVNRTPKSWGAVIFGAEMVMRWLPRGTHDFRRFVTPDEMAAHFEAAGLRTLDKTGMVFDPRTRQFRLSDTDLSVNYIAMARRPTSIAT